ncbi:hypothetical protein L3V85_15250 [Variovorax paradoxus]|jgi:hypothetical protein|nr:MULTISPECIES: hypothetical protein [Variovorax]MBN8757673.1 hypothetical protein [Variovorax sp.]UKI11849.1 hypothetical protein L3V85_15250 [Variovorax paradoxus]
MNQAELFFPRATTPAPMPVTSLPEFDTPLHFVEVEAEAEEADASPPEAYTVRLADYALPSADAARVAEQRFRREIDKQLGSDVIAALRAFQNASESSESELSKAEIAMAKRWAKAYDAARTAGFRDLGETDEAYFEVRAD